MEEHTKPNALSLIITGVALVAIVAVLVIAKRQQAATTTAENQAAQPTPVSLCYVLNKPAASGSGSDVGYLKVTTSDGGQTITGELATRPAEKDMVSGTLSGSLQNDNGSALFSGTYTAMGEGMKSVQDQLIRLDETQAQIGFGEQVQKADGSYGYKDKTAVNYSYTLPAVDCTQYDALKAAALK